MAAGDDAEAEAPPEPADSGAHPLGLGLPLGRPLADVSVVRQFGVPGERYQAFGLAGHNGLDLAAEAGELVLAVDDGEVVEVRLDPTGYGVTVKLVHAWGESRYAHGLPRSAPSAFGLGWRVRRGERVMLAAGPHIHIGLRVWNEPAPAGFGGWADPAPYLGLAPLRPKAPTAGEPRT